MKRDPVEILYKIGDVLRTKREGEEITISEIKEKAGVHWKTAKKYLGLIRFVHEKIPHISFNDENVIRIKRLPPDLEKLDEEESILAALYFKKAFSKDQAIEVEKWMRKNTIEELIEREFIGEESGKIYLAPLGLTTALLILRDKFINEYDSQVSELAKLEDVPEPSQLKKEEKTPIVVQITPPYGLGRTFAFEASEYSLGLKPMPKLMRKPPESPREALRFSEQGPLTSA